MKSFLGFKYLKQYLHYKWRKTTWFMHGNSKTWNTDPYISFELGRCYISHFMMIYYYFNNKNEAKYFMLLCFKIFKASRVSSTRVILYIYIDQNYFSGA